MRPERKPLRHEKSRWLLHDRPSWPGKLGYTWKLVGDTAGGGYSGGSRSNGPVLVDFVGRYYDATKASHGLGFLKGSHYAGFGGGILIHGIGDGVGRRKGWSGLRDSD